MHFDLTQQMNLVIYGINKQTETCIARLKRANIHIQYCIDRNASKFDAFTVPVFELGTEPATKDEKHKIIVYVALWNALQHEDVARLLYKHDYVNILFLPSSLSDKNQSSTMRKSYNYFLNGQFSLIKKIPTYESLQYERAGDDWICRESDTRITLLLPVELVFVNILNSNLPDEFNVDNFSDTNILELKPYFELFHFFEYGTGDFNTYLRLNTRKRKLDDKTKIAILKDRRKLFNLFCDELDRGLEFFIDSAPSACWNEKGYFNLIDGHHRAAFLCYRKHRRIPVSIDKKDCVWPPFPSLNEECRELYRSIRGAFTKTFLLSASVFDFSASDGYFARNFSREGSPVVCAFSYTKEDKKKIESLNQLFKIKPFPIIEKELIERSQMEFTVIIALKNPLLSGGKKFYFIKLGQMAKKYLIWEAFQDEAMEKSLLDSCASFKESSIIHEYFDGVQRKRIFLYYK